MFPISNTGISAAYILATVHFFYPKNVPPFLTWSTTSTNLLTAGLCRIYSKRFVGFIQIQCSPLHFWHQLHPRFWVLQQGKCLSHPQDCVDGVTETPNCAGPLSTPINEGHPFKILP